MSSSVKSQPAILWAQVGGLAAVQGAISLTWLIYGIYLPKLLGQFGFPETWAGGLLVIESLLGVAMEPLMGGLSDRAQHWVGTRLPLISGGVIASASLFLALPAIVLLGQPIPLLQGVLVVAIITWALAMTTFRSPALCLLGKYAFATNLPQAFSILTLTGAFVGALRPLATPLILGLGPAFTFTIGSVTLLGAAATLRWLHPASLDQPPVLSDPPPPITPPLGEPSLLKSLGLLFLTGVGMAWGIRLLLGELLPRMLKADLPGLDFTLGLGLVSIALGLFALPAGTIATRWGNQRLMASAVGLLAIVIELTQGLHEQMLVIVLLVLLVAGASAALNGTIPLALDIMSPERGGLGIGMYFGGFSATMAGFGWLIPKSAALEMPAVVHMATVAFILAGFCIMLTRKYAPAEHLS